MAPKRNPLERKAFKMWCEAGRPRTTKWIADQLGLKPGMVRKWKHYYAWEEQDDPRPGAPRGNKNAKGNKGGPGAPPGNDRAVKHGLYRKYMPQDEEFLEIFDLANMEDPIEMLWRSIVNQFTAIIRAPAIMFVKDRDDMTKELKKVEKIDGEMYSTEKQEWEIQFAWDKYASYLKAQAAAISTLNSSIRQFLNVAPEEDERRAKIALMQVQADKIKADLQPPDATNATKQIKALADLINKPAPDRVIDDG